MRSFCWKPVVALLALGVAACGDNVEVIQPSPPAVPPPPPVVATMAPASASVAVGGSVVFAVNAFGGVVGDAASWTCDSSNTGIATVSSTSTGCQATGVAAGEVTVTASVIKSGETVNVGALLTVTADDPGDDAFILIGAIGQGGKPAISPYSGQLDVTVNVERGDQTLDVLSLFVDGEAVATQNFHGPDMVAPEDEAAEQAVHPITLSFNTAEYEEETGAVTFANGVHALSAQLTVVGSMDAINSPTVRAEFDNVEGVHIVADAPGNSALNRTTGKRWYGGPDAREFVITAVPVMYSGSAVEAVTLNPFCGATSEADTEAPYTFELECDEGYQSNIAAAVGDEPGDNPEFSITSAGQHVALDSILNDDKTFPIFLDYKSPPVPFFEANVNGREGGWINAAVDLTGKKSNSNKNGWIHGTYAGEDDAGVGDSSIQLRYAKGTKYATALAAAPSSALPAPSEADAYCFIATSVDLLGNESALPKADADGNACMDADAYKKAVGDIKSAPDVAKSPLLNAGLLVGVDTTAPTVKLTTVGGETAAKDGMNRLATKKNVEFKMSVTDEADEGNAGISGPKTGVTLEASVERRDIKKTEELTETDKDFTISGTSVTVDPDENPGPAYYTVTASSVDKAGNKSDELVAVAVVDAESATAGIPSIPPTITTTSFGAAAFLNDGLSIRDYYWSVELSKDLKTLKSAKVRLANAATPVDAWNSSSLTSLNYAVNETIETFLAVQEAGPDGELENQVEEIAGVVLSVRDQASTEYKDSGKAVAPPGGFSTADKAFAGFTYKVAAKAGSICATGVAGAKGDCKNSKSSTSLTATVTAGAGGQSNPFSRVDFYYKYKVDAELRLIGSDGSAATSHDSTDRTHEYSLSVTGNRLLDIIERGGDEAQTIKGTVYAFGVSKNGKLALVSAGDSLEIELDE